MPEERIYLASKSFQALFNDADLFHENAKKIYGQYRESQSESNKMGDQKLLRQQRSYSRGCIISCVAALESFANHILKDFGIFGKSDINEDWLKVNEKRLLIKKPIDWPLYPKIIFLATLCNSPLKSPHYYWDLGCKELEILKEIVTIRNKIVHGKIIEKAMTIELGPNGVHIVNDVAGKNHWPQLRSPGIYIPLITLMQILSMTI